MGWLTMRDTGRFANGRAYLDDQFTYTRDDHRLTVLKSSMVGNTYYAAAERIETAGEGRSVFAIICLTFSRPNARDGQTFGYKDMTEHMGPHESECPASILDLLTPIEGEWPNNWRARCRANLAKRRLLAAKPTPRPGQTIVFDEPLRFNDGIERTRFEVIAGPKGKGLRFRDPFSRQVCQIPSVKKRTYRLINPAVAPTGGIVIAASDTVEAESPIAACRAAIELANDSSDRRSHYGPTPAYVVALALGVDVDS